VVREGMRSSGARAVQRCFVPRGSDVRASGAIMNPRGADVSEVLEYSLVGASRSDLCLDLGFGKWLRGLDLGFGKWLRGLDGPRSGTQVSTERGQHIGSL
jgi:hypothetical protein